MSFAVAAVHAPVPLSPTRAARPQSYSAHPYSRRHTRSLSRPSAEPPSYPPPPPMPTYAAIPPATPTSPLPAYSRRDKPGSETRLAKADRTRTWVTQHGGPAPTDGLQAYGYITDIGGQHPPEYSTSPTRATAGPAPPVQMPGMPYAFGVPIPKSRRREEEPEAEMPSGVIGRALARSMTNENKTTTTGPRRQKSATAQAKSVLRLLGRKSENTDDTGLYNRLDDGASSFMSMGRR